MGYNQLHRQIMNMRITNALRGIPTMGNMYYVVPAAASYATAFENLVKQTYADGTEAFHNTLTSALAAITAGRNDVILLDGNATHTLATGVNLSSARVNIVGMDGGGRVVQQGAKIEVTGAVDIGYVIKDTGVRNSFRNIKFIQSSTHANALHVMQWGGEGSLYENCSFVFGVANNLGGTTASEILGGSDSATCINCTFGSDVLLTTGARCVFEIDQVTAGQEFKSNYFENCRFLISSSSAAATFIRLNAVGDVLFTNEFKNTSFLASVDSAGGIALAEAVQTGTGTVKGSLLFTGTLSAMNCTKVSTATSGRNTAVQVCAPAASATGGIGIAPTA